MIEQRERTTTRDALLARIRGFAEHLMSMGTGMTVAEHESMVGSKAETRNLLNMYVEDAIDILRSHPHLMPLHQRELFFSLAGGEDVL